MISTSPPLDLAAPTFDSAPAVGHIETDAFCEGCGYSLRGQPVRREPHTQLLLSRCPECGRFAPAGQIATAGRLWLNRFSTFLVWCWLVLVMLVTLGEALALYGITIATMEEMIRPYRYGYAKRWDAEEYAVAGLLLFLLATVGFLAAQATAAAFPHWAWWGRVVFCLLRTALIAGVVAITWYLGWNPPSGLAPLHWFVIWIPYVAVFVLFHGGGGLLGALLGRKPLRLVTNLLLPRRLRAALGYLWTTDGLPAPGAVETRADAS